MKPYTYLLGWPQHNTWYYGVRYANGCDPSDLWNPYTTSSRHVKEFVAKYGDPSVKLIRKIFNDKKSARLWENRVLKRMKVVNDDKWLNKTDNVAIDHEDPVVKENHRIATIRAMNNPLVKEKLKKQRNTPEYLERLKHTLNRPRDRTGEKNGNHNTTLYKFKHTTGETLVCTQYELTKRYNLTSGAASRLVNGKYKITKGWMLDQQGSSN